MTRVHDRLSLRLRDGRLEGADRCPRSALRRARVVELLLADGVLGRERLGARHVEVRLRERGLRLLEVRLRLLELRLELARVDLEEELPLRDGASLLVDAPQEVALDVRADVRVHVALRRADPLPDDRLVALDRRRHDDLRRGGGRRSLRAGAGEGGEGKGEDEEVSSHAISLPISFPPTPPAPPGGMVRTGQWAPRTIGCVVAPRTWRWTPTTRRSADSSSAIRTRACDGEPGTTRVETRPGDASRNCDRAVDAPARLFEEGRPVGRGNEAVPALLRQILHGVNDDELRGGAPREVGRVAQGRGVLEVGAAHDSPDRAFRMPGAAQRRDGPAGPVQHVLGDGPEHQTFQRPGRRASP